MRRLLVVAVSSVLVVAAPVLGAAQSSAPGSPAAVTALVARSDAIRVVSPVVAAELSGAPNDDAATHYPGTDPNCTLVTQCVFGDVGSEHVDVLFGDSHARMWLTAMLPQLRRSHVRLVLLWDGNCPAASVAIWGGAACARWRSAELVTIRRLRPHTVFISNKTEQFGPQGPTVPIPGSVWEHGEERTIASLRSRFTRVVVIGDVETFVAPIPSCLAAYPRDVQRCSAPYPNPAVQHHEGDEEAAARAEHVVYVSPAPWLCARRCSPIIGTYIVYSDASHVTFTYERFLSTVVGERIRRLL